MQTAAVYRITDQQDKRAQYLLLLCLGLVYKQAGQITLTAGELHDYQIDYDGLKIEYDEDLGNATITLHRRGA